MSFYRASIKGHLLSGEIWETTLHIEHTDNSGAALITPITSGITAWWQGPPTPANSIQQLVNTGVGVDGFTLDELTPQGRNLHQFTASVPLSGTNANEMWPFQCTVAASTRTANPTREGRGRGFHPPYCVDSVVAGKLDSTAAAQTLRAYVAMLQAINTVATGSCVVWHKGSNSADVITSCDVGDVIDTQNRRRNAFPETRVTLAV